jgi:hypothetical protein
MAIHYIDSFNEVYISPFSKSWDMCADDFHVFLIFISLEIVLTVQSGTYRDKSLSTVYIQTVIFFYNVSCPITLHCSLLIAHQD